MDGSYNWGLVTLSYLVSVLGALTALQLAIGIPLAQSTTQKLGAVFAAALAMGGGAIWSMHFIAMLAYEMPMTVLYDTGLTLLSVIISVLSCAIGLALAGIGIFSGTKVALAGVFMGLGVAGMHYTGMTAMLMHAEVSYDRNIVLLSVVIAIIASTAALWLAFHMRGLWQMLGSAIVMGVAVCGMHYTGMVAARYHPLPEAPAPGPLGAIGGDNLGLAIFVVSAVLLGVVMTLSYSRHQRRQAVSI